MSSVAEAEGNVIVLLNRLPDPILSILLTPKIALSAWVIVGVREYRSELLDEAIIGKVHCLGLIHLISLLPKALA